MTHSVEEIDKLLRPLAPALVREADVILDLRDLLVSRGHPGKCVRCFFRLFEAASGEVHDRFAPLRAWLEEHVVISVSDDCGELETLPFVAGRDLDLAGFCQRSIDRIRMDRAYQGGELRLAFRYRTAA